MAGLQRLASLDAFRGLVILAKDVWFLLAMLSVAVLWRRFPAGISTSRKPLDLGLRLLAGLVLAVLLAVFRGKNAVGQIVWLQHSWWGILGLIGWAYLVCGLAYVACRGNSTALMGVLGFLIALYIGSRHGALDWLPLPVQSFIGVGPVLGSTAADVMIGVLVGNHAAPNDPHPGLRLFSHASDTRSTAAGPPPWAHGIPTPGVLSAFGSGRCAPSTRRHTCGG